MPYGTVLGTIFHSYWATGGETHASQLTRRSRRTVYTT